MNGHPFDKVTWNAIPMPLTGEKYWLLCVLPNPQWRWWTFWRSRYRWFISERRG